MSQHSKTFTVTWTDSDGQPRSTTVLAANSGAAKRHVKDVYKGAKDVNAYEGR